MSSRTLITVDFPTIEQPDLTATHGKCTIFARLHQTLTNISGAFLGISPTTLVQDPLFSSSQQPPTDAVDIDWPLFYQCCDFSFYWIY